MSVRVTNAERKLMGLHDIPYDEIYKAFGGKHGSKQIADAFSIRLGKAVRDGDSSEEARLRSQYAVLVRRMKLRET